MSSTISRVGADNNTATVNELYHLEPYTGEFALHSPSKVCIQQKEGHMLFTINLFEELRYVRNLIKGFARYFQTTDNPLLARTLAVVGKALIRKADRLMGAMDMLHHTIPQHSLHKPSQIHNAHSHTTSTTTEINNETATSNEIPANDRKKRFLDFISLAVGVANSAHLIILDSMMAGVKNELTDTVHRVNDLSNIVETNARTLKMVLSGQRSLTSTMSNMAKWQKLHVSATSVLALMELAMRHCDLVLDGLKSLIDGKLPMDFFNPHELKTAFGDFTTAVGKIGFEPVSTVAGQIYEAQSSFVLTTGNNTSSISLSILTPIPLKKMFQPKYDAYIPEPTIIQLQDTTWRYNPPKAVLLVGGDGKTLVAPDGYLDRCKDLHQPWTILCPPLPLEDDAETCMAQVYLKGNLSICQDELSLVTQDEHLIFQKADQTYVLWAAEPMTLRIICMDGHRSQRIQGLHRLATKVGCTTYFGSFTGSNFQQPRLNTTSSIIVEENLGALLELPATKLMDKNLAELQELAKTDDRLIKRQDLTMKQAAILAAHPIELLSRRWTPYIALAGVTLGVLGILVVGGLYWWRKRQMKRLHAANAERNREALQAFNLVPRILEERLDRDGAPIRPVRYAPLRPPTP